jgi:hypothetical protein
MAGDAVSGVKELDPFTLRKSMGGGFRLSLGLLVIV